MNHQCRGELCPICEDRIEAEQERREGRPRGYNERSLGDLADAQAANEWAARDY